MKRITFERDDRTWELVAVKINVYGERTTITRTADAVDVERALEGFKAAQPAPTLAHALANPPGPRGAREKTADWPIAEPGVLHRLREPPGAPRGKGGQVCGLGPRKPVELAAERAQYGEAALRAAEAVLERVRVLRADDNNGTKECELYEALKLYDSRWHPTDQYEPNLVTDD